LWARGVFDCQDTRIDTRAFKFAAMEPGRVVISQLAHIASGQSPGLTRNHSGCRLPARKNGCLGVFNLGAALGVIRKRDQRVGSIQSHPDKINQRQLCHGDYCKVRYAKRVALQSFHAHTAAVTTSARLSTAVHVRFIASAGMRACTPSQTKTPTAQARMT